MNRRGFLSSLAAVLAFPKRLFHRNTLITPEWVKSELRLDPQMMRFIGSIRVSVKPGMGPLTIVGRMGEEIVVNPGETVELPRKA